VRTRWRALRRAGKEEEFHDTWVLSGAAVMRRGEPVARIFQLDKEPKPPPESTIIASGDGAGPKRKSAGWGGIVMAPAIHGRAEPEVKMLAGPVITDEDDERYDDGADAPTNNAGELIAMIRMKQEGVRVTQPGDHVEVQSDSMVALMAALGACKQTRRKNRRKDRGRSRRKNRTRVCNSGYEPSKRRRGGSSERANDKNNAPQSERALWTRMERDSG
jgi:ribonuclease HI